MVRVLYIFVLVSLLSLSVVNAQNEMHWKKVFHGQVGPYTEEASMVQWFSADTVFILSTDSFYCSPDRGETFAASPVNSDWFKFDFASSQIGFAVGWLGLVKKSTNSGQSWYNSFYMTQRPMRSVDFITPVQGIITGDGGGIFRTNSGGSSWQDIPSVHPNFLIVVKWITPNIVMIGGDYVMLRSIDAGLSFSFVSSSGSFGWIYDIDFYDPEKIHTGRAYSAVQYDNHFIIATGGLNKLHRSTDYGLTWTDISSPVANGDFRELDIADNKRAFVYGSGSLWESNDEGKSWRQYLLPQDLVPEVFDFQDSYNLFGMRTLDAHSPLYFIKYEYQNEDITILTPKRSGHIFSNKQRIPVTWRSNKVEYVNIEYTTDNGSTWYLGATVPAAEEYHGLLLPDVLNKECFVRVRSASNPTVGDTCDYSFTVQPEVWQIQSPPISGNISSVTYPTPSVAYCGTKNGVLLKSTDSAKTWQTIHTGANADITAVGFFDEQTGLIGTAKGEILQTVDGGQTWNSRLGIDTTKYIKKILIVDGENALMLPSSSTRMYITMNKGLSWGMTYHTTYYDTLNDMDYCNGEIYAVGKGGAIHKSSYHIGSYTKQSLFTTADLWKVTFGSENFGYVFTEHSDSVIVTHDGFATHTVKPFPVSLPVIDLKATAPSNAFVLLQGGRLYATDTFAESWEDQTHRFLDTLQSDIRSLAFISSSEQFRGAHAVAVGDHGTVYRRLFYEPEPVSVIPKDEQVPYSFSLAQNYPNPFNPSTTLEFTLPKAGFVTLKVYDVLGSVVQVLVQEVLPAGKHSREFFAQNLPSGIYLSTLQTGDARLTRKMILVK